MKRQAVSHTRQRRSSASDLVGRLARSPVTRAMRVADQVHRELRRAIIQGEIKAGTRLRESEVASALNVSRTPVREAISRLTADWLVGNCRPAVSK